MENRNQSDQNQFPLHVHHPAQDSINPPKPGPASYREPVRADLSALLKVMPPFVLRTHPKLKEWTGYSGRTMANFDSLKQTTSVKKVTLGNTIAYERHSLVAWIEARSRVIA